MAGTFGWRAWQCVNGSNGLAARLSRISLPAFDQVCTAERCLNGASASTSALLPVPQHAVSPRAQQHAASAASAVNLPCCSHGHLLAACPSPTELPHRSALALSALRGLSAAAAAAAAAAIPAVTAAAVANRAQAGGASSGSVGSSSRFQAPWPWVDPSQPQVLPVSIGKKQRQPVPLQEALTRLLGALAPEERPRQSLEVFIRFRLDPRRSDHLVRGSVVLPYGTGKDIKLVVFAKGADAEIARAEGVELIGDEDLIASIVSTDGASIAFDRLIATPEFMKPLARAGKVLGPKGLMPNPKMGTLTTDVAGAIRDIRRGRLDYRLSREATVRAVLGRGSMSTQQLAANVGALVGSLWENRPRAVAGPTGGGGGGAAAAAAPGGAAAGGGGGAVAAAPTVPGLERYFMTFLLKTNHSPSDHISFDSLIEAAARHSRPPAATVAAPGGAPASAAAPPPQKEQEPSKNE